MRTGAARDHHGYFHEAAIYETDDQLLEVAVPFLEEGLAHGEPTLVCVELGVVDLLRDAVDLSRAHLFDFEEQYVRPIVTIHRYREVVSEHVRNGAGQVRVIGTVPHPGLGVRWEGWSRYEAAVNHAFAEFPLWGLCAYDARLTPERVLDEVRLTHPFLAGADGSHERSECYVEPRRFLATRTPPGPDPAESGPPAFDFEEPSQAVVRAAVRELACGSSLAGEVVDDLVLAASEAVGNAIRHGSPPSRARGWACESRVVVTVSDRGSGPDVLGGLTPDGSDSRGLLIIHGTCSSVSFDYSDGFTIRLVAGEPLLDIAAASRS